MKNKHYTLLINGLRVFPVLTALVGGAVGYSLSSAHTPYFEFDSIAGQLASDFAFGAVLGFLGGFTLSSFGRAGLALVKVENDSESQEKKSLDKSTTTLLQATKIYKKADFDEHKETMVKLMSKYKEKLEAEKVERSRILAIRKKDAEEKRRAQLEMKSSAAYKSSVKKTG